MSTWLELRQEILFNLDCSTTATTASDVRNAVDLKLRRFRRKIYGLKPPKTLLVNSSTVSIPSTLDYIKVTGVSGGADTPSFALTDFWQIFTLTVEDEDWEFTEWDTWVRGKSGALGDQRIQKSFTMDYNKYLYLNLLPTDTTWEGVLHYYKVPPTIVDGDECDIGEQHEDVLIAGVTIQFPQLFVGETREKTYNTYASMYKNAYDNYMRDQTTKKVQSRLRPKQRRDNNSSTFWGTGETS